MLWKKRRNVPWIAFSRPLLFSFFFFLSIGADGERARTSPSDFASPPLCADFYYDDNEMDCVVVSRRSSFPAAATSLLVVMMKSWVKRKPSGGFPTRSRS